MNGAELFLERTTVDIHAGQLVHERGNLCVEPLRGRGRERGGLRGLLCRHGGDWRRRYEDKRASWRGGSRRLCHGDSPEVEGVVPRAVLSIARIIRSRI